MDSGEDKNIILRYAVLSETNLNVSKPQSFKPRIVLYDVPVDILKI